MIVSSGQSLVVFGEVSGVVVLSGGVVDVLSGGTLISGSLGSETYFVRSDQQFPFSSGSVPGGQLAIASGGVAIGTMVFVGASETIAVGGTDSAASVLSGGTLAVLGIASNTVVASGRTATILSGGTEDVGTGSASGVTLGPGAALTGLSGGIARAFTLLSGKSLTVTGGLIISGDTLASGASVLVVSRGIAVGDKLQSGASETVQSGGVVFSTDSLTVGAGGTAAVYGSTGVNSLTLEAGGTIVATQPAVLSRLTIGSGATFTPADTLGDNFTYVGSGGTELVEAGEFSSAIRAGSGGSLIVRNGGTATSPQVGAEVLYSSFDLDHPLPDLEPGGTLLVSSGGVVRGAIVEIGNTAIVSANGTIINAAVGAIPGNRYYYAHFLGGTLIVSSGGTATYGEATIGGTLVLDGGSGFSLSANVSGSIIVSYGGIAVDAVIESGGSGTVLNGGIAVDAVIESGGSGTVLYGGTAVAPVISAGGTLTLEPGAIVSGTVDLTSPAQTVSGTVIGPVLAITGTAMPNVGIAIAVGSTIDLPDLPFGAEPIAPDGTALLGSDGFLRVTELGQTVTLNIANAASLHANYALAFDAGGGTEVIVSPPCYVAGTRIATPGGPRCVEDLRPGDLVLTLGGARLTPKSVQWVGWLTVDLRRHPHPAQVAPVRIRAHAFAPNRPRRDLLVSPDHGVL